MKTLFVDIMLHGMFQFMLRYRYCPAFKIDLDDVYSKVIERRPSLEGKPFEMFFD